MKGCLVALCFIACLPVLQSQVLRFGQEPTYAKPGVDYPIKVHISGIRVRSYCSENGCDEELRADAMLNQQKVELTGRIIYGPRAFYNPRNAQDRLMPGNYTARLLKTHKGADSLLYDEYELLMPDQRVWHCQVTGIFE